jgi:hypothetical protein
MICNRGVRALTLKTVHPEPLIQADLSYMRFEYEDGKVFDQWTEMDHRDGDEPMVDVLEISFQKKTVTDAVWETTCRSRLPQSCRPRPSSRKSGRERAEAVTV